jgi:hypothetical protein
MGFLRRRRRISTRPPELIETRLVNSVDDSRVPEAASSIAHELS